MRAAPLAWPADPLTRQGRCWGPGSPPAEQDKPDAIDKAVNDAVAERNLDVHSGYRVEQFVPFNPVDKRTEARLTDLRTQKQFKVTKGAPHIIRSLAEAAPTLQAQIDERIIDMASRGFRSLGVAVSYDLVTWEFVGASRMAGFGTEGGGGRGSRACIFS